MSPELKQVAEYARQAKMEWVEKDQRGDVPPIVIVQKGGRVVMTITAPDVDKNKGLTIAQAVKMTVDPDLIMMVMDAHFAQIPPGVSEEEAAKMYPPGSMQKMCDEEGACDTGAISDCLICSTVDRNGEFQMDILPYSYHGKGTTFKWTELPADLDDAADKANDGDNVTAGHKGYIPATLHRIMTKTTLIIDTPEHQKMMKEFNFTRERALFHAGRSMMRHLEGMGCTVKDDWSGDHPEWIST